MCNGPFHSKIKNVLSVITSKKSGFIFHSLLKDLEPRIIVKLGKQSKFIKRF